MSHYFLSKFIKFIFLSSQDLLSPFVGFVTKGNCIQYDIFKSALQENILDKNPMKRF